MSTRSQPRHQEGTSRGGQFASCPQPDDPTPADLLTVPAYEGAPSEQPTIEAALPDGTQIALISRDGVWQVQGTWETSALGLKLLVAAQAPESGLYDKLSDVLRSVVRGQVVAEMLNEGELTPEETPPFVEKWDIAWAERVAGRPSAAFWLATTRSKDVVLSLSRRWDDPSAAPDSRTSAAENEVFGRVCDQIRATYETARSGEPRPLELRVDATAIQMLLSVSEITPGDQRLAREFSEDMDALWGEAHIRVPEGAAPLSLDDVRQATELADRIGGPTTLALIYDSLIGRGNAPLGARSRSSTPYEHVRDHGHQDQWTPWLLMSKAHQVDMDVEQFSDWFGSESGPTVGYDHLAGLFNAAASGNEAARTAFVGAWLVCPPLVRGKATTEMWRIEHSESSSYLSDLGAFKNRVARVLASSDAVEPPADAASTEGPPTEPREHWIYHLRRPGEKPPEEPF